LYNPLFAGGRVIKRIIRTRLPERLAGTLPPLLVELGVGLLVAALFVVMRVALEPMLGDTTPYPFVFVSVVIAAVLAGWRAALLALVIGQILIWLVVVEPRWTWSARDQQQRAALLVTTFSQLIMLAIVALYQREVDRGAVERERRVNLLDEALREIDHRTRNNYQTVLALIHLQAQRAREPEVKEALGQTAARIEALALASQQLAIRSEDLGSVRLGDHLCSLCERLERALSRDEVKVHCDVADVVVPADRAICLSIIVNELVTNALKHAFHDGDGGVIQVESKLSPQGFELSVADNGQGMPSKPKPGGSGLGRKLIETFVRQLGATHQVSSSSGGTRHMIVVPSLL
jgi:two-component sensor histidine kinase